MKILLVTNKNLLLRIFLGGFALPLAFISGTSDEQKKRAWEFTKEFNSTKQLKTALGYYKLFNRSPLIEENPAGCKLLSQYKGVPKPPKRFELDHLPDIFADFPELAIPKELQTSPSLFQRIDELFVLSVDNAQERKVQLSLSHGPDLTQALSYWGKIARINQVKVTHIKPRDLDFGCGIERFEHRFQGTLNAWFINRSTVKKVNIESLNIMNMVIPELQLSDTVSLDEPSAIVLFVDPSQKISAFKTVKVAGKCNSYFSTADLNSDGIPDLAILGACDARSSDIYLANIAGKWVAVYFLI